MAVSNISIAQISGAYLFNDSANGATVVAVKASSGTIYEMELDNSANGAATYFKLFNVAAGSVVLGTTAPDLILLVPASTKITLVFPSGLAMGTAISCASVTDKAVTSTDAPSSSFVVKMVYT